MSIMAPSNAFSFFQCFCRRAYLVFKARWLWDKRSLLKGCKRDHAEIDMLVFHLVVIAIRKLVRGCWRSFLGCFVPSIRNRLLRYHVTDMWSFQWSSIFDFTSPHRSKIKPSLLRIRNFPLHRNSQIYHRQETFTWLPQITSFFSSSKFVQPLHKIPTETNEVCHLTSTSTSQPKMWQPHASGHLCPRWFEFNYTDGVSRWRSYSI